MTRPALNADGRMPGSPTISVIVPVPPVSCTLSACLASVRELDPPCDEVIVVVDGRGGDSAALAEQAGGRVLQLDETRGPAAARNSGARAAMGDILLFVDADVTVRPDTAAHVRALLEQDPALAGVFGSYDDRPAEPGVVSQYKNLAHHFIHQSSREDTATFWGACGAVRRRAFFEAGGFDERYVRPSIEDVELGGRLFAGGHRIRLVKTLQVTHLKRWSFFEFVVSDIRDRAVPWTRLILESRRMPRGLNFGARGMLAVACASLLAGSLLAAPYASGAGYAAAGSALGLFATDRPILSFFRTRRGLPVACLAAGLHWCHHLCAAFGFAVGTIAHAAGGRAGRTQERRGSALCPDDAKWR